VIEEDDILTDAIKQQSRLLADIEVIDACDIIKDAQGFKAVPDEFVGKRRIDIGMDNRPRRWWGMISELNQREKMNDRPWGKYEVLLDDGSCKVKKITVNPKCRLSYQSHQKRAEVWVVISGHGKLTFDDDVREVSHGAIVMIPFNAKHRIENIHDTDDLVFVETQLGTYFGEDDIKRYEDDYGRQ